MTSTKSSPVMDTFSLPSGYLAPLQTLWEHFLRWMFIEERPHTLLQKASQGLRDLLRGAPRLILPFPSPPSTTLFSLLSYSSRQKTDCLCHILMCTIADRRHATSRMWLLALGGTFTEDRSHMIERWRECLYLFLCLCYSRGLAKLKWFIFLAHSMLSLSRGVIGICNEADLCVAKCLAGQEVKVSETLQLLEWRCCWNSLLACNHECSRFVQENIFFDKP